MTSSETSLDDIVAGLRTCRICRDEPWRGGPLPHEPRPIIQASASARLCIASQAPGKRAHVAGVPFLDPSGVRLRSWLGIDEAAFYDASKVAIVPMAHCFPGYDAKGGDLPPRRECAPVWRERVFAGLPNLSLILTIGMYAQDWHLAGDTRAGLTDTVSRWREILAQERRPRILPMPHPSWRNNGWLKKNPWFENELLPVLREEVRAILSGADDERESAA
jgi:uracil-DNA glycosylase